MVGVVLALTSAVGGFERSIISGFGIKPGIIFFSIFVTVFSSQGGGN